MWLHFAEDNSTPGPSVAAAEPIAYEVGQATNPTLLWLLPWAGPSWAFAVGCCLLQGPAFGSRGVRTASRVPFKYLQME